MFSTPSSNRLANALADAKAAEATAVLIGRFTDVADGLGRLRQMQDRLERARASTQMAAKGEVAELLVEVDALATGKIAQRLVEADAIVSPVARKSWLSDVHRAATQVLNSALEEFASGTGSLLKADAARQVLFATREAMRLLGRTIEQNEKPRKARTASRRFAEEDYADPGVRRAIVMLALNGDAAAAEYLEIRAYDPELGRDGRIASIIDALGGEDQLLRDQVVQLAGAILARDAAEYRIDFMPETAPIAVVPTGTMAERANAVARGAS